MRRRHLLLGTGALAATAAAAWRHWPPQGFLNPCRGALPPALAQHTLVQAAWDGIDPARVWDCHVHLVGTGDSGSGIWINPAMTSLLHPLQFAQRVFFLNAGCAHQAPGRVDETYVERLRDLMDALPAGVKLLLLAFDHTFRDPAEPDTAQSAFHTPNRHAQQVAAAYPRHFEWIASVHPYRADCVEALEWAAGHGARAVKWLPPAMGIDPASPRCDRFYAAAARLRLPLLTHAGAERSVPGANQAEFGNPLKLRRALDHGVRVVVAHCASIGDDRDLDRGADGPVMASFELFARLMDEPRYVGRLYGDASAIAQANRAGPALRQILERTDWHDRLLNGSDYPLPGIMPLFSVDGLVAQDFVERAAAPVLKALREHNPLLFDFVLKRQLHAHGKRFPPRVFHTREFFAPADMPAA